MKNKTSIISNISTRGLTFFLATALLISGFNFPGFLPKVDDFQPIKTAQANALCTGITIYVEVFDVTDGQIIGEFIGSSDGESFEELSIPYGHEVRYTFDTSGTPSFTSGRQYQTDDGYSHEEHTWAPNPTPNMSSAWTAPAIQANGFFIASAHENVCTKNPPHNGNISSTVHIIITVTPPSQFSLTCGVAQTVPQGEIANYTLVATISGGYNGTLNVTMTGNPAGPVLVTSPVVLSSTNNPLPYQAVAQVPTIGLITNQLYVLTFTGTDGTNTVGPCQSTLLVTPVIPTVDLKFNGSDGPINPTPANGSTGQLSWETTNAASCSGSMQQGADTTAAPVGPWTGSRSTANVPPPQTFDVSGMQLGTYIFKLTCTSLSGGQSNDIVQVDVTSSPQNPTVDFNCSGENPTTPSPGPCHITIGGSAMLYWTSAYATDCTMLPDLGYEIPTNNEEGASTGSLNSSGSFPYRITCAGAPGTTPAQKTVTIIVDEDGGYSTPLQVSIAPGACGKINVTWQNPSGPAPTGFNVYRRTSLSAPWVLDPNGTNLPYSASNNYLYVDNSPLSQEVSNYYAMTAVYPGGESDKAISYPQSVIPSPCGVPNLSRSDKDISRVVGKISKTFPTVTCSGESEPISLPNGALFSANDVITFELNACNSGNTTLDNITIRDTLHNLSSPANFSSNPAGCMTGHSELGSLIDFTLAPIPPPAVGEQPKFCSITFTAVVTAPTVATASIFRFQNVGDISATGANAHVFTPPYPFSIKGGVPDRNETAPQ